MVILDKKTANRIYKEASAECGIGIAIASVILLFLVMTHKFF